MVVKLNMFTRPRSLRSGSLTPGTRWPEEISFSPRRHAFRVERKFPVLLPIAVVAPAGLKSAKYYVTLELGEPDPDVTFEFPRTRTASWEMRDEEQSPLIRRLGTRELALLFRGREPRVKQPVEIEPETRALTRWRATLQRRKQHTKTSSPSGKTPTPTSPPSCKPKPFKIPLTRMMSAMEM